MMNRKIHNSTPRAYLWSLQIGLISLGKRRQTCVHVPLRLLHPFAPVLLHGLHPEPLLLLLRGRGKDGRLLLLAQLLHQQLDIELPALLEDDIDDDQECDKCGTTGYLVLCDGRDG